eukprot:TRINITY_DN8790_c0_g1_i1.p1 TRINITY_DN8790_c0_g1~~TRINITY_DN8790_c0_g1_i1.p1  ORF type:complete len:266 (+),score=57.22 TRINITY_DN8790_c0_g1_i1:45-842(+)
MFSYLRVASKRSNSLPSNFTAARFCSTNNQGKFDVEIIKKNASIDVSLNNLRDIQGAKKSGVRLGRGPGTGRGKTAKRGIKGQKSRQGGSVKLGFEGGQTPYYKRLRKHGFTNARFKRTYSVVNLDKLQLWIDQNRLNPTETITMAHLIHSGCAGKLRRTQQGVKILGQGAENFVHKVDLEISQISDDALKAIEKNGGSVKLVYYDKVGLRSLFKPENFVSSPPYYPPPPFSVNRNLRRPMEQPQQLPEWIKLHEKHFPATQQEL